MISSSRHTACGDICAVSQMKLPILKKRENEGGNDDENLEPIASYVVCMKGRRALSAGRCVTYHSTAAFGPGFAQCFAPPPQGDTQPESAT